MAEHVVLKNAKLALKSAMEAPMKAGMPKVSIDAGHLKWLIEQAEDMNLFVEMLKPLQTHSDSNVQNVVNAVLHQIEDQKEEKKS